MKSKGWHLRVTQREEEMISVGHGMVLRPDFLRGAKSDWNSRGSAGHCPGTEKARISRMVGAVREKETSPRGMPLEAAQ